MSKFTINERVQCFVEVGASNALTELEIKLLKVYKWLVSLQDDVLPNLPDYETGMKQAKEEIVEVKGRGTE